jgi:3',5'-cyclic AMP phosphodiesterase CpdA
MYKCEHGVSSAVAFLSEDGMPLIEHPLLPRENRRSVLAVHISDLHFRPKSFDGDKVEMRALTHLQSALVAALGGRVADLLFVTGDVIDSERWDDQIHLETLQKARKFLENLCAVLKIDPTGLVVIGGNHDFRYRGIGKTGPLDVIISRFKGDKHNSFHERMRQHFERVFPEFDKHRLYTGHPSLLVACFDSNETRGPFELATGVANIQQVNELHESVQGLAANMKPLHRIALIHHHPLPVPAAEILDARHFAERTVGRVLGGAPEYMLMRNSGVFLKRLLEAQFSLVLHGHLHCTNYWGPVFGDNGAWLEIISAPSFCDCDGRRSFGIVELHNDGQVTYSTHWTNAEGWRPAAEQMKCCQYERARDRLVRHLEEQCTKAMRFRCSRVHVVWDVRLPEGDICTTQVLYGLRAVGDAVASEFEMESWASALTRQTFEAAVLGEGPQVRVRRRIVNREAGRRAHYSLQFTRPLARNEEITLATRRTFVGATFLSQDAQRFWGIAKEEVGHETCTHTVRFPCDELTLVLRFSGSAPERVDLLVSDHQEREVESEQQLWRNLFNYANARHTASRGARDGRIDGLGTITVRRPLIGHMYSLRWKVLDNEPIPEYARLWKIRRKLLTLKHDAGRSKACQKFLKQCVVETRREIRRAGGDDGAVFAYLFCIDTDTVDPDADPPSGATMVCVASTAPESDLARQPLLWGRDIVGRAARRGDVIVSFDRSALNAVEVLDRLPGSVALLVAYPLHCDEPDPYPSAVLAVASPDARSGLAALTARVDADDEGKLLKPIQQLWLAQFPDILKVARLRNPKTP